MSIPESPNAVFVYGTLKKGQCRESCWPLQPESIQDASIRANLFDREDYPALGQGENTVVGQLWTFQDDDIDKVIHALDKVEGAEQPGSPDLYHRVIVEAYDDQGGSLGYAYTYMYANDPTEDGFQPMTPDASGKIEWVR
ncbi:MULTISPECIES: gamma-glutamylcyclotransferase [Crateriforma]|uniref:AIG2-like family protein n=1 Tax=Crateriforma conspicua TaxID=2527996 RepID=A0A5C6FZJ2_9PLAN|nr:MULTISPECIES: gamma-glutamylcyclotransferase family protein [Crateriforma]TWU66393.1 AIG2-like family protein [Crateriforma conspicua]